MTMKTAIKERSINPFKITIESLHLSKTFEESKKGQLMCPVCSEQVRLILGIEQDPYFQHVSNKNTIASSKQVRKRSRRNN